MLPRDRGSEFEANVDLNARSHSHTPRLLQSNKFNFQHNMRTRTNTHVIIHYTLYFNNIVFLLLLMLLMSMLITSLQYWSFIYSVYYYTQTHYSIYIFILDQLLLVSQYSVNRSWDLTKFRYFINDYWWVWWVDEIFKIFNLIIITNFIYSVSQKAKHFPWTHAHTHTHTHRYIHGYIYTRIYSWHTGEISTE